MHACGYCALVFRVPAPLLPLSCNLGTKGHPNQLKSCSCAARAQLMPPKELPGDNARNKNIPRAQRGAKRSTRQAQLLKCEKKERREWVGGAGGRANESEYVDRSVVSPGRDETEDSACRWRVRNAAYTSLGVRRFRHKGPQPPHLQRAALQNCDKVNFVKHFVSRIQILKTFQCYFH